MSEQQAAAPAPSAPAKRRTLLWVVLTTLVLVIVAGASLGAFFWFRSGKPAPTKADKAKAAAHAEGGGIIRLEPFVVNLADAGAVRFARVSLTLVVTTEEQAAAVEKNEILHTRLRSAVLEVLTTQTSAALVTPEGKTALKTAIAERCSTLDAGLKVTDVLFTDFVVQY